MVKAKRLQSQSQGHVQNVHRWIKFNAYRIAYSVIKYRDDSTQKMFISWPTVTLQKGQRHSNEHEHINYTMHKSTVMPRLNAIA